MTNENQESWIVFLRGTSQRDHWCCTHEKEYIADELTIYLSDLANRHVDCRSLDQTQWPPDYPLTADFLPSVYCEILPSFDEISDGCDVGEDSASTFSIPITTAEEMHLAYSKFYESMLLFANLIDNSADEDDYEYEKKYKQVLALHKDGELECRRIANSLPERIVAYVSSVRKT